MFSGRGRRSAARTVALAIAASLSGAPQVLASTLDHAQEHRCRCPAGAHQCSCARCALNAARKAGAATGARCHGASAAHPDAPRPPGHAPAGAEAGAPRPPCHGPAATATAAAPEAKAPAEPRPLPAGAPCVSGSCDDRGPELLAAAAQEPYVPAARHAPCVDDGPGEDLAARAGLAGTFPAAPEPPPPRA